jgi:hypothetical protein
MPGAILGDKYIGRAYSSTRSFEVPPDDAKSFGRILVQVRYFERRSCGLEPTQNTTLSSADDDEC